MTYFIIIVAVSGYVSLLVYRSHPENAYFNIKQGWEFVFQTLLIGLFNLMVTYIIYSAINRVLTSSQKDAIEYTLMHMIADRQIWLFLFNFATSVLTGLFFKSKIYLLINKIWITFIGSGLKNAIKDIRLDWSDRHELIKYPQSDLYSRLYELIGDFIMVTLTSGKVYIGYLEYVDLKADIPFEEKGVTLKPLISGYRDSDTHQITYTTDYDAISRDDITVNFFLKDIRSFTKFDQTAHKEFNSKK